MNSTSCNTNPESRWRTYFKAVVFLIPPLAIWAFSCVFLFPKLQQIWKEAGFVPSFAQPALHASNFLMHHWFVISLALIFMLVLLEWRSKRWLRYRRAMVGVTAFLVNTAVLVFITAMFMSAIIAAPALLQVK